MYQNCIANSLGAHSLLPLWLVAVEDGKIRGVCGLIPNDFISRMDLTPWVCSLCVDEYYRNQGLASMLLDAVLVEAKAAGYDRAYLTTDLVGFYERYGWRE